MAEVVKGEITQSFVVIKLIGPELSQLQQILYNAVDADYLSKAHHELRVKLLGAVDAS